MEVPGDNIILLLLMLTINFDIQKEQHIVHVVSTDSYVFILFNIWVYWPAYTTWIPTFLQTSDSV